MYIHYKGKKTEKMTRKYVNLRVVLTLSCGSTAISGLKLQENHRIRTPESCNFGSSTL